MLTTAKKPSLQRTPACWGALPEQMDVLFVSEPSRKGAWLAEAFASDSAMQVLLEEAAGAAAALTRLRDSVFDIVLISHAPRELNAIEILDAVRTGSGYHQPIIVLGEPSEHEMAAECFEAGADAYLCIHTTTTRALIWQVARAAERHQLIRDHQRLQRRESKQLELENSEALETVENQRAIARGLSDEPVQPSELMVGELREILRTYVIMGSGNLQTEVDQLARKAIELGCSPGSALLAHTAAIDDMIRGLGNRSARHVMNRANLLAIELMTRIAERYASKAADVTSSA